MNLRLLLLAPVLTLVPGLLRAQQPPDDTLFQAVLTAHVLDDGKVRYAALKQDLNGLTQYVNQIGAVSPNSHPQLFPNRQAGLAYWINTYNALVLWAMTTDYPKGKDQLLSSVRRANFFYRRKFKVAGRQRTLSDIEDNTLRAEYKEPRIHFAIVCASASCPALSRTVYTAANVEQKLEEDARRYFAEPRNFRLDTLGAKVHLPAILKWFSRDFGKTDSERLAWVARYRPAEAPSLRTGTFKIEYFDYDWSLNDAAAK